MLLSDASPSKFNFFYRHYLVSSRRDFSTISSINLNQKKYDVIEM